MRGDCGCLRDGELINYGSTGRTMGFIREDENEKLLCVFNASGETITFRVPDEFIGGKLYMDTELNYNDLIIPANDCAFVKIKKEKLPEKPELPEYPTEIEIPLEADDHDLLPAEEERLPIEPEYPLYEQELPTVSEEEFGITD